MLKTYSKYSHFSTTTKFIFYFQRNSNHSKIIIEYWWKTTDTSTLVTGVSINLINTKFQFYYLLINIYACISMGNNYNRD